MSVRYTEDFKKQVVRDYIIRKLNQKIKEQEKEIYNNYLTPMEARYL